MGDGVRRIGTVAALYEGVRKSESSDIPLLASPQGGVAVSSKDTAKRPKRTQPGWFSFFFLSENHPGLAVNGCFAIFFLNARPPLLAVMQGGEYRLIPICSHLSGASRV